MTNPDEPGLVVGADVGGTSTRVAVSDLDGSVLGLAAGGPGNPHAVGLDASAAEIHRVTALALHRAGNGADARVRAVVVGLAGGSAVAGAPGFRRAAVPAEVSVPAELVSDLGVAFASASDARAGTVLVAGTGAVAGWVEDDEVVTQRDGWGWLLGDDGSGFWLGRAAVRATLDTLQRGEPPGPLARAVLTAAGAADDQELVRSCYAGAPVALSRYAVLVGEHADDDPVAARVADEAAGMLERLLLGLSPVPGRPVVLAGSVLARPGPVRTRLLSRLAEHGTGPVLTARSGVVGALWVGLRRLGQATPAAHRRLTATGDGPP